MHEIFTIYNSVQSKAKYLSINVASVVEWLEHSAMVRGDKGSNPAGDICCDTGFSS